MKIAISCAVLFCLFASNIFADEVPTSTVFANSVVPDITGDYSFTVQGMVAQSAGPPSWQVYSGLLELRKDADPRSGKVSGSCLTSGPDADVHKISGIYNFILHSPSQIEINLNPANCWGIPAIGSIMIDGRVTQKGDHILLTFIKSSPECVCSGIAEK